jgi:hypothetical protein
MAGGGGFGGGGGGGGGPCRRSLGRDSLPVDGTEFHGRTGRGRNRDSLRFQGFVSVL